MLLGPALLMIWNYGLLFCISPPFEMLLRSAQPKAWNYGLTICI